MKSLKHIISKKLHRKARAAIFILTVLVIAIALIYPQRMQAGETYTNTNKNGIKVISTSPIQEKHEIKAHKTDSSHRMTASGRRMQKNDNAQHKHYKDIQEERGKLLLLYSIFK